LGKQVVEKSALCWLFVSVLLGRLLLFGPNELLVKLTKLDVIVFDLILVLERLQIKSGVVVNDPVEHCLVSIELPQKVRVAEAAFHRIRFNQGVAL
jgi:hypothetical protein